MTEQLVRRPDGDPGRRPGVDRPHRRAERPDRPRRAQAELRHRRRARGRRARRTASSAASSSSATPWTPTGSPRRTTPACSRIRIPVAEQAKPRKISISSNGSRARDQQLTSHRRRHANRPMAGTHRVPAIGLLLLPCLHAALQSGVPQCLQNFWPGSPLRAAVLAEHVLVHRSSARSRRPGASARGPEAASRAPAVGGGVSSTGRARDWPGWRRRRGQHRGAGRTRCGAPCPAAAGRPDRRRRRAAVRGAGRRAGCRSFFLFRDRSSISAADDRGEHQEPDDDADDQPHVAAAVVVARRPPSTGSGRSLAFSRYSLASSFVGWLSTTVCSFSTAVSLSPAK